MKKNIYLVQANAIYGEDKKSCYIPYSIGSLSAYAWADDKVKNHYRLGRFIYTREKIDAAIDSLDSPFLVGFSSYVWNMEYNLAFAKRLKAKYPNCLVLFGGHSVSPAGHDMDKHSFIDFLIHGEGEVPFRLLLLACLGGAPFDEIHNISFRNAKGDVITTVKKSSGDVGNFPSPYLEGFFDELLQDNNLSFSLVWETNRGCPNHCAYCDWSELKAKVREISMERIKAEIEWMAENQIEYIYCADANFGILDRDEEITDLIIDSKLNFGYPHKFKTNFTKNRDEFVVKLGKKLMDHQIGKSPTLAFQSLNPTVLKNIGRTNMDLDYFKQLMALYYSIDVNPYSELILGLPGETYESFTKGMCTLLEYGQHKSIGVYPCELLPNSLIADPVYMAEHGIKAVRIPFSQYHCSIEENDAQEFSDILISTNTMTLEDWKRSYMFSLYIQSLHNIGLTRALAIYLYYEKGVSYINFYEKLIVWFTGLSESTVCKQEYTLVKELTHGATIGKNAFTYIFEGFGNITWGFEEHIFLNFAQNLDAFFDELISFVKTFDIEEFLFEDLIAYQKGIVKKLNTTHTELSLDYDFFTYFQNIFKGKYAPLEKIKNTLAFEDKQPTSTWEEYARVNMWYGRRDDGLTYTGNLDLCKIIYE